MIQAIIGKLEYLTWDRPWALALEGGGTHDAAVPFWDTALAMAGQRAGHSYQKDFYALRLDEGSPTELRTGGRGEGAGLFNMDGSFGFSNVAAYLEWTLVALNGREVIVLFAPGRLFRIEATVTEQVPEVKYYGSGNMGRIPAGEEFSRCKAGEPDCCIFLTGAPSGFQCAKFSGPLARSLLHRKAQGTMRATRIGNCRLVGREEE